MYFQAKKSSLILFECIQMDVNIEWSKLLGIIVDNNDNCKMLQVLVIGFCFYIYLFLRPTRPGCRCSCVYKIINSHKNVCSPLVEGGIFIIELTDGGTNDEPSDKRDRNVVIVSQCGNELLVSK